MKLFFFSETTDGRNRYLTGLKQLEIAAQQVAVMQVQLEDLEPQLKIAAQEVAVQVAKVELDSEQVAIQRELVRADELVATEQGKVASKIREECDVELEKAMPILEAALAALNTLTTADITIVRSLKSPPVIIKVVMEAVCILRVFIL